MFLHCCVSTRWTIFPNHFKLFLGHCLPLMFIRVLIDCLQALIALVHIVLILCVMSLQINEKKLSPYSQTQRVNNKISSRENLPYLLYRAKDQTKRIN